MSDSSLNTGMSRRQFLATGAAAGITLTALPMSFAQQAGAQTGPRSLVCVFLEGGADSANMYVPLGNTQSGRTYAAYAAARGDFALDQSELIPIGNGDFGLNNQLPGLAALANEGRVAVVHNIGPLDRPTSREDFRSEISVPQSLFAHDAQRKLWQTGRSELAFSEGWGGAISAAVNSGAEVAPSFSISGSNIWSTDQDGPYSRLSATVPVRTIRGYDISGVNSVLAASLDIAANSSSEIVRALTASIGHAIVTTTDLQDATADTTENETGMTGADDLGLGRQLEMVARLIKNRQALNMPRQLFFVRMDGWDTHGEQDERFPVLLDELDRSLTAFQAALDGLGVADSVTTFTSSDFGRTLTSNGDGTDHAWGGYSFVVGSAVTPGGYGAVPSYAINNNPDDTGDRDGNFGGRWIPTTSVAQYGATFARWMGLSEPQIDSAFPLLSNFGTRDIGFLGAGTAVTVGDVNCDGVVNTTDSRTVLEYLVGTRSDGGACPAPDSATQLDAAAGDIDEDGSTTIADALSLAD